MNFDNEYMVFFASARDNKHLGFFKKNVRYETFF